MLKKLLKFGIISVGALLFFMFLTRLIMPRIVSVQEIRWNPSLVEGDIAVIGIVVTRDDDSAFFLLSEHNMRCKEIPIVYKGRRPKADSEIIAYGRFRKADKTLNADILWWEYFLEADKIKTREDIFSGHWAYTMRQRMNTLYEKCNICQKIKNRLVSLPFLKRI